MSRTEDSAGGYSLRVDKRGVVVEVRGRASVDLFEEALEALSIHPDFHPDMPAVWDMSGSEGLGRLSREEMDRMVLTSRRARGAGASYRVAVVAPRDVDFGVGRMFEGSQEGKGVLELGTFRNREEAERWAFSPSDEDA